jgi:hypothetical protein
MNEIRFGLSRPPVAAGSAGNASDPAERDLLEPDGGARAAVPQSVYWRRRAVAFVVGIGLLAVLAWAVNGTLSSGATSGRAGGPAAGASGASHAHGHGHKGASRGGSGHGGAARSAGSGRN